MLLTASSNGSCSGAGWFFGGTPWAGLPGAGVSMIRWGGLGVGSGVSAGSAVALIYLLVLRVSRARWASLLATLAFAYSQTFWSQSVIAEHYPFAILSIAAVLGCVLAWDRRGERYWLFTSAVVYGLCLTHRHGWIFQGRGASPIVIRPS